MSDINDFHVQWVRARLEETLADAIDNGVTKEEFIAAMELQRKVIEDDTDPRNKWGDPA